MRIAGIIAEYNPLHNGHLRLFQKVREELSEQTPIVVIMSGVFVQRGIPSLTDRESRVCALLCNGADLVFELPFTFATGSADRFAHGGVSSLLQSGVITDLYFGAEHPSLSDLSLIAEKDFESDPVFSEKLEQLQKDGLPYAAAWQEAAGAVLEGLSGETSPMTVEDFKNIIRKPNNILAVSYLRELHRAGSSIVPHLVCREGSYHEEELSENEYPSATALRKTILDRYRSLEKGDFIRSLSDLLPYVPTQMLAEMLHLWNQDTIPMGEKELLSYALPLLRSASSEQLQAVAHVGPQLSGHLRSSVRSMHFDPNEDLSETFRKAVETRCFSYTRILRGISSLCVGQTQDDLSELSDPLYLRLLGFSEKGRSVLSSMRKASDLPILSRASDANHYRKDQKFTRMNELDRLSHDLWTSIARNTFEEDFKREVIQYKRNKLYR
ncbi:MAG: nucleotidyltransferase family protein [Clostridiales bacterium]|nr:nucleotidyltransferase family protein [Clostridiales bacterium]